MRCFKLIFLSWLLTNATVKVASADTECPVGANMVVDQQCQAEMIRKEIASLPFIRYLNNNWVRAENDLSIPLAVCRVGEMRFSCPEIDKQKFGKTLLQLEQELKALVPRKKS